MNKRIEELAKQSGFLGLYDYGPDPKDLEEFAKLIVKDCLFIVQDQYNGRWDDEDWFDRDYIMDHFFGVENEQTY